jgi:hypothetical protein
MRATRLRRAGLLCGLVALLVALTPATGSSEAPTGSDRSHDFPDVPTSNPFHTEISWMVDEGFMAGFGDGTFRPTAAITRQSAVGILWRMSGEPGGPFDPETFTDVDPTNPFYDAIRWAVTTDVVNGYTDGTFRPTAPLSRQAMGRMLRDLSGLEKTYGPRTFSDVPSGHPFNADIAWWVNSGQARGFSDGTFRPTLTVSRQAGAELFFMFFDMMGGAWPYLDHHDHECEEDPTPEQEARATQIIADVEEVVSTLYPTRSAAEAAGYEATTPSFGGEGPHMVNVEFAQDGLDVDDPDEYAEAVTKPESLVLDNAFNGGNPAVAAAMYVREYVGQGPTWPPEPVGCVGTWHAHDNLCYDGPFLEGGNVVMIAGLLGAGCPSGSKVRITPEMFHVWRDAYWNGGPFDGIET